MQKKDDTWKFHFPAKEDASSVERKDITMKLPQPNLSGGTTRAVSAMTFSLANHITLCNLGLDL